MKRRIEITRDLVATGFHFMYSAGPWSHWSYGPWRVSLLMEPPTNHTVARVCVYAGHSHSTEKKPVKLVATLFDEGWPAVQCEEGRMDDLRRLFRGMAGHDEEFPPLLGVELFRPVIEAWGRA